MGFENHEFHDRRVIKFDHVPDDVFYGISASLAYMRHRASVAAPPDR